MIALLRALAGLIAWAVGFSAIYGLQGLVCTLGWQSVALGPLTLARLLLQLTHVLWMAVHLWLCWTVWPLRQSPKLVDRLAAGLAIVGFVSSAYSGLPVWFTSTCT